MRRRLFKCVVALIASLGTFRPSEAAGQAGLTTEGAPFLLIPIGARALGMGQAVVADRPGTEAVWWNPAGIARADKREIAVHHYQTFVGTGDAISVLYPSSRLGVLVASVFILNYGEQTISDAGGFPLGSILPRNLVYAATYSTPVGTRFNAGVTFKVVQFRVDCSSGNCSGVPLTSASTSAVDAGVQYDLPGPAPLTLAAAVRNLGLKLQVNDREQADPLPTRVQVGVLYNVTQVERYNPDAELHLTGDVLDQPQFSSPSLRFGAEVGWRKRIHLRGGYVFDRSSDAAGPSVGIGLSTDALYIDLARIFEGFSQSTGQTPIYVSLRFLF